MGKYCEAEIFWFLLFYAINAGNCTVAWLLSQD